MLKLITNHRVYLYISFIALLVVLLFFGNLAIVKANPGGYDFFTHWYATRIYIKDGVNPYSELSVSRVAGAMMEELTPGEGEIFRFTAPLFSIVFLTPFSLIGEFTLARAMWMTMLEISLLITGWILLTQTITKKNIFSIAVLTLIILFSLPSISAIMSGSLTIVSLLLFALSVTLLARQQDEAAGFLLAFSLIKAEVFYLGVVLLLIWSLFRGRTKIIWWFLGTFGLLIGFSILLIPDWIILYLRTIVNYSGINPLQVVPKDTNDMTNRLNLVKNVAIVILLIFEWIVVKAQGKRKLVWNIALLLLVLPWFGRVSHIEHTILYIPSLIAAIGIFWDIWKEKAYFSVLILSIILFLLTWVFSGVFIAGISIVLSRIIIYAVQPLIILILLYWSRWWVLRSEKFEGPIGSMR